MSIDIRNVIADVVADFSWGATHPDRHDIVNELARLFGPAVELLAQCDPDQSEYCIGCLGRHWHGFYEHKPDCLWVSALAPFTTPEKGDAS